MSKNILNKCDFETFRKGHLNPRSRKTGERHSKNEIGGVAVHNLEVRFSLGSFLYHNAMRATGKPMHYGWGGETELSFVRARGGGGQGDPLRSHLPLYGEIIKKFLTFFVQSTFFDQIKDLAESANRSKGSILSLFFLVALTYIIIKLTVIRSHYLARFGNKRDFLEGVDFQNGR